MKKLPNLLLAPLLISATHSFADESYFPFGVAAATSFQTIKSSLGEKSSDGLGGGINLGYIGKKHFTNLSFMVFNRSGSIGSIDEMVLQPGPLIQSRIDNSTLDIGSNDFLDATSRNIDFIYGYRVSPQFSILSNLKLSTLTLDQDLDDSFTNFTSAEGVESVQEEISLTSMLLGAGYAFRVFDRSSLSINGLVGLGTAENAREVKLTGTQVTNQKTKSNSDGNATHISTNVKFSTPVSENGVISATYFFDYSDLDFDTNLDYEYTTQSFSLGYSYLF